eukprot:365743-Chlamydomonas_euryale.AAC.36
MAWVGDLAAVALARLAECRQGACCGCHEHAPPFASSRPPAACWRSFDPRRAPPALDAPCKPPASFA